MEITETTNLLEGEVTEEGSTKRGFEKTWLLAFIPMAVGVFSPVLSQISWLLFFVISLAKKDKNLMLMLFIVLLTLSDSRSQNFQYAQIIKVFIAPLFGVFSIYYFGGFSQNKIIKLFIPFFILAFILSVFSNQPFTSFQKSFSYFLIFTSVPVIFNDISRKFLVNYFYLIAGILVLGLILNQVDSDFTQINGRYRGMLGNPNGLGIYLAVNFLFYQISRAHYSNLFSKREEYIFLALFIISLFYSQSRNAIVVFGLFYMFGFLFKKAPFLAWLSIGLLIPSYLYLEQEAPRLLIEYGLGEYFRVDTLKEGSGRTIAWNFAWEKIQDNFFIGNGFASTEHLFKSYYVLLSNLGHQGNAHNSFLTLWLDTGLFGLVLYVTPVLVLFRQGMKKYDLAYPILICVLFSSFFESWLAASLNPFTIIFVMILTILVSEQKEPPTLTNLDS